MKIVGIEGLTTEQIHNAVLDGARFVIFQYCFSVILMTYKKGTDIHFVRPTDNAFAKGLPYTLLSLVVGWWGIPWGPIYTIQSVWINSMGGRDVTPEVLGMGEAKEPPSAKP